MKIEEKNCELFKNAKKVYCYRTYISADYKLTFERNKWYDVVTVRGEFIRIKHINRPDGWWVSFAHVHEYFTLKNECPY